MRRLALGYGEDPGRQKFSEGLERVGEEGGEGGELEGGGEGEGGEGEGGEGEGRTGGEGGGGRDEGGAER